MNSNTLRIRGSEHKRRGGSTFSSVVIPDCHKVLLCKKDAGSKFLEAGAEEQINILKYVLNNKQEHFDVETVGFLVVIYLQADTKHPAKCMITRFVTKNHNIQEQFSNLLTQELKILISTESKEYKDYANVVSKIGNCTENFPTGAAVIRNIQGMLAKYFKECLGCCTTTLRVVKPLSPTDKNEIYNLAHSTLRLILYIVQKTQEENIRKLTLIFNEIRTNLKDLLFDMDAPMDSKSVCGILYVTLHILENNSDSWIDILESNIKDIQDILLNESAKLSLYSALITVVPMQKLQITLSDGTAAIVRLTNNILHIGERCSAESTFILGVTRTIVQICKGLHKIDDLALTMLDGLFVYVWSHLEHYMDSVRHLTAQALGYIIKYCANLKKEGKEEAINKLFSTLTSLDRQRKSFYLSVTCIAYELGALCVMEEWPKIVEEILIHLNIQAIQASATTCLETLLQKHVQKSSTNLIYKEWITPMLHHISNNALDSAVLNILENLLTLAIKCDKNIMDYILPYIKESCGNKRLDRSDIKCLLILLSVLRKSGELKLATNNDNTKWKDIISYEILKTAAVDACEENRILSISLVVESPKSTEAFVMEELDFVVWFIKYNMNAQAPHFRQLMLSVVKKFLKRLESSYKAVIKENNPTNQGNKGQYYLSFLFQLQDVCFEGLIRGANFSRRYVSLLLLTWVEKLEMDGYHRQWNEEQVEILLHHLGDSYENNKALALEMLEQCPVELLENTKYSTSLNLEDILEAASSVKPTDCITAVYKLKLLQKKLPEHIVQGSDSTIPNKVKFALLKRLLRELQKQLSVCKESIVYGARNAPMYGILHCIGYSLEGRISPFGLPPEVWTQTIQELVNACIEICACAGDVLNSAAPEGMLPTPCEDASGNVRLEDGSEVTAQMILLCAWRSVKEVSLTLSTIATQALSHDEFEPASRYDLVKTIGELFTQLLTETKHRGAFEQVYVGFTRLLTSLWRNSKAEFNELPKQWLSELISAIENGDNGKLCATRRSAGLPFMIQALVITELQVKLNSKSFDNCMRTLLRLAKSAQSVETRCHCLNILRALYRNTHLDEIVGSYVGDGLLVALQGFESNTWVERNSSTLLFSALMVRIFGVQRSKDTENLCVRNRMTGRIFFLRYPKLYDFMLKKLKEVSENKEDQLLRPSLYPILLLLARLYPSSLEGTVSNLKLVAFVPHVVSCGHSAVLKTRQLAAKAMPPLISPELYISHIENMFQIICDRKIKRNYCHGILLQLIKLLESKPEGLTIDEISQNRLILLVQESIWILKQSIGDMPCYIISDEYIKIINILVWRYKTLITEDFTNEIQCILNDLLFKENKFQVNPGKELCQSNAVYLNLIFHIYNQIDLQDFIYKCLLHHNYEIVLSALNYLLILFNKLDIEISFQEHLNEICNKNAVNLFKNNEKYKEILCKILKYNYLECTQKSLMLLTLENNTQKEIIEAKSQTNIISDEYILSKLFYYIENEHENLTHIYLGSLCDYVTKNLDKLTHTQILEAIRVVFSNSLSDNSNEARKVVVEFLVHDLNKLLKMDLKELSEEERFEFRATLFATLVTTLEDDDETLRLSSSRAITSLNVIPTVAAKSVIDVLSRDSDNVMLLSLVALLDFRAEVCMTDDVNDECRVFDHNEKYNVYLEEAIWTRACANNIKRILNSTQNVHTYLYSLVTKPKYIKTFEKLCNNNFMTFQKLVNGERINFNEINPKIDIFVTILKT